LTLSRVEKYITKNLFLNIFSIFIPLFFIASLVFLVRVASITSVVAIDFWGMIELYSLAFPEITFYVLPLSFFIGSTLTFSKLSFDSEMVVLFSFGISPKAFLRLLLRFAIPISIMLLFISMIMIPHASQMNKVFLDQKKHQAIVNLKATEFGQKFGDWSLFIEKIEQKQNRRKFVNVALFHHEKKNEQFIFAKSATILSNSDIIQLHLEDGSLFTSHNGKISKVHFKYMKINDLEGVKNRIYLNSFEYFKHSLGSRVKRARIITNISLSLFPVVSVLLILAFGIQNSRYGKGVVNFSIGVTIALFYFFVFLFSKEIDFATIYVFLPIWTLISYKIYKKRVLERY
jgi:lipopolysaccharide export system permease protein